MARHHPFWFNLGFTNLFPALNDIHKEDVSGLLGAVCSRTFVGCAAADLGLHEAAAAANLRFDESPTRGANLSVVFASQRRVLLARHRDPLRVDGLRIVMVGDDWTFALANNKAALDDPQSTHVKCDHCD